MIIQEILEQEIDELNLIENKTKMRKQLLSCYNENNNDDNNNNNGDFVKENQLMKDEINYLLIHGNKLNECKNNVDKLLVNKKENNYNENLKENHKNVEEKTNKIYANFSESKDNVCKNRQNYLLEF